MKLLIAVIVIGAVIATVEIYKSNTVRNQTVIEETDRDILNKMNGNCKWGGK
jgi:hypothetical protein